MPTTPQSCDDVSGSTMSSDMFDGPKGFVESEIIEIVENLEHKVDSKEQPYDDAERDTSCGDTRYLPAHGFTTSRRFFINYDDNDTVSALQNLDAFGTIDDRSRMEEFSHKIAVLDARLAAEIYAKNQQILLMSEYEKKTHEMLSSKNREIDVLKAEKRNLEMECKTMKERLAVTSKQLDAVGISYNDVHEKYERAKQAIYVLSRNVEILKNSLLEHEDCITRKHNQFLGLKEHAIDKLNHANIQLDVIKRRYSLEILKLRAALDEAESKTQSLSQELKRKNQENAKLTCIYINLLQKLDTPLRYSLEEQLDHSMDHPVDEKIEDDSAF